MSKKKITDEWFKIPLNVDRQLLTKENSKFLFGILGKQIMSCIEREKIAIPKDNFMAFVYVKFIEEKKYMADVKRYNETFGEEGD